MKLIFNFLFLCAFLSLTSCKEDEVKDEGTMAERMMKETYKNIDKYVAENHLDTNITETGVVYVAKKRTDGKPIRFMDGVKVNYRGTLLDGTEFDKGTIDFVAGAQQVIAGWDGAIELMKEGEQYLLIIPFWQAYGEQPYAKIPPYSTLVFDMEVLKVVPHPNEE
jgi:FKBP-type peptidyl-prolyl cis-trans isomerase FkpA